MSEPASQDIRQRENAEALRHLPEAQGDAIAWLKSVGALRSQCSSPLACAAHDCPVPCEACSAEGEVEVVCTACRHVFPAVPVSVEDRACASEAEFVRARHIAFFAEARTLLLHKVRQRDGRERSKSGQLAYETPKGADRGPVASPERGSFDRKREQERRSLEASRKRAEERKRLEDERRRADAAVSAKVAAKKSSHQSNRVLFIVGALLVAAGYFMSGRSSGVRSGIIPPEAVFEAPAEASPREEDVSKAGEPRNHETARRNSSDDSTSRVEDASSILQDPEMLPAPPTGSAWLGVALRNLDDAAAQAHGLPGAMGALVYDVVSGSPAEAAGLRPGDVLLVINGELIDAVPDVFGELRQLQPGMTIEFRVVRDKKDMRVSVTLGRAPPPSDRP